MKKIRLSLEELAVESFATDEHTMGMAGTVEGHGTRNQNTCPASCNTCGPGYTCYETHCTEPTVPEPTCIDSCLDCLVETEDYWECVPTYGCPP
ncbi:MAG: hypothetical protein ACJ8GN_24475 [Longimicrobiaceae bacterium]